MTKKKSPTVRRCDVCNCKLNSHNTSDRCAPCRDKHYNVKFPPSPLSAGSMARHPASRKAKEDEENRSIRD